MARCLIVTIVCWISAAVWLSCDSVDRTGENPFNALAILLSFSYPLFPLVPAAGVAIFSGTRMGMRWWLRGILAGAVCSGIVVLFLVQTEQSEPVAPLASAMAGFLIGIAAPRSEGHLDNPLLH